ncbi:MAG: MBL fold metallo-hydrolase [Acidobacteria bacterium]|nr:MBL fold metallo-hydrolase [Acidobacteriota bacterium]
MQATLTFLGSGTSMGVPTLGCTCAVCTSTDPHNKRTRPSIAVQWEGHTVIIDTGQEFRLQALREGITHVDAVLYTHGHADHILGMDDLRPLSFKNTGRTPLYGDAETLAVLRRVFEYTFRTEDRYPTSARVELCALGTEIGEKVDIFGIPFERVPVMHGHQAIAGYRFGSAAYLTDMSDIPDASRERLQGIDILILDALRREPHPTHAHLVKSVEIAQNLAAKRTFFTHISHDLDHETTNASLPDNIRLAYDGLRLEFEIA